LSNLITPAISSSPAKAESRGHYLPLLRREQSLSIVASCGWRC
jgi:hypothetical protein